MQGAAQDGETPNAEAAALEEARKAERARREAKAQAGLQAKSVSCQTLPKFGSTRSINSWLALEANNNERVPNSPGIMAFDFLLHLKLVQPTLRGQMGCEMLDFSIAAKLM